MHEDDKKQFAQIVRSTMLVCGGEAPEVAVLRIWWAALMAHDIADVSAAFSQYAIRGKFAPKPADILEIIDRIMPDGRPGAEEAWAMIPQDEQSSCVMTDEMTEAWGIAKSLIDDGDRIGARMTFKEVYSRLVDASKQAGTPVRWFPSLGSDAAGRAPAMAEAVRLGRLGVDHVRRLLSPEQMDIVLQISGVRPVAIENKSPVSDEQARQNIAKIRLMIGNSRIAGGG